MNNEKQIAQTIIDAQKMREDSYVPPAPTEGYSVGEYKLDIATCLQRTCKAQGLPPSLWYLLDLACHWSNDVAEWAETILANKNVYSLFDGHPCEPYETSDVDDIKAANEVDEDELEIDS